MSYFQQLYDAASNDDEVELRKLLAEGACIDERERSAEFNTVAGKLARKGEVSAAKKLIYRFGAGPEFVVDGFLKAGFLEEASLLAQQFQIDTNSKQFIDLYNGSKFYKTDQTYNDSNIIPSDLRAFAYTGNVQYLKDFNHLIDKKIPFLDKSRRTLILNAAAYGGQLAYLEQQYAEQGLLPNDYSFQFLGFSGCGHFTKSFRFQNAALALHSLSFVGKYFRDKIVEALQETDYSWGFLLDDKMNYDIEVVRQDAIKVNALMTEYHLDYDHAVQCLKKTGDELSATLKVFQLMECYQISEKQALLWLTNSNFRDWFRKYQQFNLAEGNPAELPAEIVQMINEFVLEDNYLTAKNFFKNVSKNKIDDLKFLNKSSSLFFKTVDTHVEEAEILEPATKKFRAE